MPRNRAPKFRAEDSATVWFAVLDRALADGDLARADEAQRELRRLGFTISVRAAAKPTNAADGAR